MNRGSAGTIARPDNLAGIFQEALTVIMRLRSGRLQVENAAEFRRQIVDLLKSSLHKARERGYSEPAAQLCILAMVAFLDESVLNAEHPGFAEWRGKPLQEELYGDALAGERLFENLRKVRAQPATEELPDLLEVFYLCILLGYRGRYAVSGRGELDAMCSGLRDQIGQLRGGPAPIAPSWALPRERLAAPPRDVWGRRIVAVAVTMVVIAAVAFLTFKLSLRASFPVVESAISSLVTGNAI